MIFTLDVEIPEPRFLIVRCIEKYFRKSKYSDENNSLKNSIYKGTSGWHKKIMGLQTLYGIHTCNFIFGANCGSHHKLYNWCGICEISLKK